jgi:hypothetical protein
VIYTVWKLTVQSSQELAAVAARRQERVMRTFMFVEGSEAGLDVGGAEVYREGLSVYADLAWSMIRYIH